MFIFFLPVFGQKEREFKLPDGINDGVVKLIYKGTFRRDILIKFYQEQIYLPFYEILNYLKIYNEVDYKNFIVKGFYIDQSKKYTISFKEGKGSINEKRFSFDINDILFDELEVYALPSVFKEIFDWNIEISMKELSAKLKTEDELPIYLAYKRRKQYNFLNNNENGESNFPLLFDRSRNIISFGLLDYNIKGSTDKNNNQSINSNLNFDFEIFGGDVSLGHTIYYQNKNLNNVNQFRGKWRYYIGDNDFLRSVSLGDISTNSLRMSSIPTEQFFGVQITNERDCYPSFFSNFTIEDRIKPNWQVELYKDGFLYSQMLTDVNGYYQFSIPINYGFSNYELRFYGDKGEYLSKQTIIQIPPEIMKPGEFKYFINIGESKKITNRRMYEGRFSAGIFNWLSNSTSIKKYEGLSNLDIINSMSIAILKNLYLSYDFYYNYSNTIRLRYWPFDRGNYELKFSKFEGKSIYNNSGSDYELSFNTNSPRIFNSMFYINLSGRRIWYNQRIDDYFSARLSFRYNPINIDLNYNYNSSNNMTQGIYTNNIISTSISISSPFKSKFFSSSRLGSRLSYDVDDNRFNQLQLSFDQRINNNTSLNARYIKDFFFNHTSFQLNLRIDFDLFRSSSDLTLSREYYNYSQSLNGIIGIDSKNWDLNVTNPIYRSLGTNSAIVRLFIDENNNNNLDDGEPFVENVKINIQGNRASKKIKDKATYFNNLYPYEQYNVSIEQSSIKNPMIVPKITEFSFISEPNRFKSINIPCFLTGIIEGTVLRERDGKTEGQAGVKIHIMSEDSSYHETQPVFSDGSFYKMGLMPGNYLAWVDSLQCAILDVYQQDTIKRFTVKSTKAGDFIEGLDFVLLDRKEKGKKKVIIETISTPIVPEAEIKIDTLVNGNGKIDDRKPTKKLSEPKFDSKDGVPNVLLLYKESKWTWLSVPMQKELDKVAKYLIENPNAKAQIDGHSDNFGTMEENMKVSEQRVKEVVNYLYRKGIALSRLYSSGHGALYPVGDNKTAQGRAKNRRVEVKIIE
ncbi:MAG: OmpA family protein [Candidatus Kapabacteria bacterium]|nr:OmpA family protein [Candidatus Kapabacteria bacterium]